MCSSDLAASPLRENLRRLVLLRFIVAGGLAVVVVLVRWWVGFDVDALPLLLLDPAGAAIGPRRAIAAGTQSGLRMTPAPSSLPAAPA